MAKQIILGLIIAGLGGSLIYFSSNLVESFGAIPRLEKNLGGTRNGYVVIGFIIMIIGFLILFGMIPTTNPTETIGGLNTVK